MKKLVLHHTGYNPLRWCYEGHIYELVRPEGNELIYLQTDDLEVTIKGGTNGLALPFVRRENRDYSLVLAFNQGHAVNV